MQLKYIFVFNLLLALSIAQLTAQTELPTIPQIPDKAEKQAQANLGKKLSVGGNFSIIFNPLLIDISPNINYQASRHLVLGAGLGAIYTRRSLLKDTLQTQLIWTGRTFARITVARYFNLQAEYELMQTHTRKKHNDYEISQQKLLHNPLFGGGLRIPVTKYAAVNITMMYNFNYQKGISPYPSPWVFRLGLGR
jgi:hypothetical protein